MVVPVHSSQLLPRCCPLCCAGRAGFRKGTIVGKISFFSLAPKFYPRNVPANLGCFLPCAASLESVARYCCAVVGSPSVPNVRSSCSLGGEKLVVVENVRELRSLTVGALQFPLCDGPAPKLVVGRIFPSRNCAPTKSPPVPPLVVGVGVSVFCTSPMAHFAAQVTRLATELKDRCFLFFRHFHIQQYQGLQFIRQAALTGDPDMRAHYLEKSLQVLLGRRLSCSCAHAAPCLPVNLFACGQGCVRMHATHQCPYSIARPHIADAYRGRGGVWLAAPTAWKRALRCPTGRHGVPHVSDDI